MIARAVSVVGTLGSYKGSLMGCAEQSAGEHDRCSPGVQPLLGRFGQGQKCLGIGFSQSTNTSQSSVGGSIQSFQVGLVVYMLPMLPRTLATGDLYPDNVEIMSIFNVARHILVNIEVSAAV